MEYKSQEQLFAEVTAVRSQVAVGGTYYHYKHPEKFYVVEFVGFLESSEEVCVGYRSLYGKGILWVRTVNNFMEKVEVNGENISRFVLVEE